MSNANLGTWASQTAGYLLVVTTGLLILGVAQELVIDTSFSMNKWGLRTVYTLASEPARYWGMRAIA